MRLPHSGQNFGGLLWYSTVLPQEAQPIVFETGFCSPQFSQNFPLFCVPQDEHIHRLVSAAAGAAISGLSGHTARTTVA